MASRPSVQAALSHVERYSAGAGFSPRSSLIEYQAERAVALAEKLSVSGAVVLDDPVGTGKTAVSLVTAELLLSWGKVDRILVIAPNRTVKRLWSDRAQYLDLVGRVQIQFKTSRKLPASRPSLARRKRSLIIIDEAHRDLQKEDNNAYRWVAWHAADAHVLLVTATPFQLEARGLTTMLSVPEYEAQSGFKKRVNADPIIAYASAVAEFLVAEHDSDPTTTEEKAQAKIDASKEAAQKALDPFFIPRFRRKNIGLEESPSIPTAAAISVGEDWMRFYHLLRVLPELPRLHDLQDGTQSSDSYQRMLLSSHQAVVHHKAFDDFRQWAAGPTAPKSARDLLARVQARLLNPDPLTHPKVAHTARWVADKLRANRHVLVFCVYSKTQPALADAIQRECKGLYRVTSPDDANEARGHKADGFGSPTSPDNPPMAMVVRDRLSESIDLDGGNPCVAHHDLVWNPVRWEQRMGRVIRASSDFAPVAPRDILVSVLPVATDTRLLLTMTKRRELSEEVMRMASLVGDHEEE